MHSSHTAFWVMWLWLMSGTGGLGSGDTWEGLGLWAVGQRWYVLATWVWDCHSALSSLNPTVTLFALQDTERAAPANAWDAQRASGQGKVMRAVVGLDSPHFRYLQSRLLNASCHTRLPRQQEEISVFIMQFICSVLTIYFRKRWITIDSIDCIDWLFID